MAVDVLFSFISILYYCKHQYILFIFNNVLFKVKASWSSTKVACSSSEQNSNLVMPWCRQWRIAHLFLNSNLSLPYWIVEMFRQCCKKKFLHFIILFYYYNGDIYWRRVRGAVIVVIAWSLSPNVLSSAPRHECNLN
jgi:hypothetical protein